MLQCNVPVSKSITLTRLYYSYQLETTFHKFCDIPLHITFKYTPGRFRHRDSLPAPLKLDRIRYFGPSPVVYHRSIKLAVLARFVDYR